MFKYKFNMQRWSKLALWAALIFGCLFAGTALAADNNGIGGIAENVTESFSSIGKLMLAVAYLAGIGFAIAAIFKFKQHKDNPQQIPLGTPIALLVVGVALIFIANFIEPAGQTLGFTKDNAGGFKGEGVKVLPGSSSSS